MLTPWARDKLATEDGRAVLARADAMGVDLGATYSSRHRRWAVSGASVRGVTRLNGRGPLAAVLAGLLDDVEARS